MKNGNKDLLIAVGNIYLDHNIFGVDNGGGRVLEVGKDYFASKSEVVVGGSAVNFAIQATKLGIPVAFLGAVGDDEEGREAKRLLEQAGVSGEMVITASGAATSVAINMVFAKTGEFIGTHYGEASINLDPEQIDFHHPLWQRAKAVYFGGTAKQKKVFKNFPHLFQSLQEMGIKVIVDPNRFSPDSQSVQSNILLESLKHVDCYLPNEEEIKQVTGKASLDEALEAVGSRGVKLVVVKRGPEGCRVKSLNNDFQVPGFLIESLTTVGAGDAFNAGFIIQLLNGKPLEECAKFANADAAIKVSKNINPTNDEVRQFLQSIESAIA